LTNRRESFVDNCITNQALKIRKGIKEIERIVERSENLEVKKNNKKNTFSELNEIII
jgi:hypothetical protein